MALKNQVPVVDRAALEAMPTRALLGRLRRLLRCEESPEASDAYPDELALITRIAFKCTAEWRAAHEEVKAVLAHRPHVPRSAERKAARASARTGERR
jgi:hypothetical protein